MKSQRFCTVFKHIIYLFAVTSLFVVGFSFGQNRQQPESPRQLRCEYQSNPLGIDVLKSRLSWLVNDSRRGAIQSAFQILVASEEDY